MRIAHVGQPFDRIVPPVRSGSIALWMAAVAERQARGADVRLYARRGPGEAAREAHAGVEYRRFPPGRTGRGPRLMHRLAGGWRRRRPFIASDRFGRAFVEAVADDLAREPADIVHVQNTSQFIPALREAAPGARIILHMGCEWLTQLDPALVAPRIAGADVIAGCSSYLSRTIARAHPLVSGRCAVLVNGIDAGTFRPGRSEREPGPPRVLYVGRVSPEKGVHVLLEAFGLLRRSIGEVELDIVGPVGALPAGWLVRLSDDPLVRRLERFYGRGADYGAALRALVDPADVDAVTWHGAVPHDALPDVYRRADVVVNPALSEAFGRSLVEAMSTARPVVAASVGGMPEIIHDGVGGRLVPADDPRALAGVLAELVGDEAQRRDLGRRGRAEVEARFDWDRVAEATGTLYAGVRPASPAGRVARSA